MITLKIIVILLTVTSWLAGFLTYDLFFRVRKIIRKNKMTMIIKLILISLITCFIIDVSGVLDSMDNMLQKVLGNKMYRVPKPFSCSLCMTFWCCLFYLLFSGNFTLALVSFTCVLSMLTPIITRILYFIRDFLDRVIENLEDYFSL